MNIIVTGATSMIGVALIKSALIDSDINRIYAIVRPNSLKIRRLPQDDRIIVVESELGDYVNLCKKIEEKIDVFFHLAWSRTATYNETVDDAYEKIGNLRTVVDALKVARELGCKTFVGAGSQSEYGIVNQGVIGTITPCKPVRVDGILHLAAGEIVNVLATKMGINSAWIRIFSIYGTNDRENSMIMSTIHKLIDGEKCLFTACEQIWDYLYEDDAGEAFLLVGKKTVGNKIYCLGSGEGRTLKSYLDTIRNIVSPDAVLGIGELPYPNNPIMNLQCDISELVQDTGWRPKVPFEEGIRKIFYVENKGNK